MSTTIVYTPGAVERKTKMPCPATWYTLNRETFNHGSSSSNNTRAAIEIDCEKPRLQLTMSKRKGLDFDHLMSPLNRHENKKTHDAGFQVRKSVRLFSCFLLRIRYILPARGGEKKQQNLALCKAVFI